MLTLQSQQIPTKQWEENVSIERPHLILYHGNEIMSRKKIFRSVAVRSLESMNLHSSEQHQEVCWRPGRTSYDT